MLAARWKVLSSAEKKPFEDKAKELKAVFDDKRKRASPAQPKVVLPSGWRSGRDVISGAVFYTCVATKKSQWARPSEHDAVTMPPAPPSARRFYETATKGQGLAVTPWADLSPEAKAPYEETARNARASYKDVVASLRRSSA